MSRFYFTMDGGKSNSETVTRRAYGRIEPGPAQTVCASWKGAIVCQPYVKQDGTKEGADYVRITRRNWRGSQGAEVVIYDGPFDVAGPYATDLK